jgi:hypothetical protein
LAIKPGNEASAKDSAEKQRALVASLTGQSIRWRVLLRSVSEKGVCAVEGVEWTAPEQPNTVPLWYLFSFDQQTSASSSEKPIQFRPRSDSLDWLLQRRKGDTVLITGKITSAHTFGIYYRHDSGGPRRERMQMVVALVIESPEAGKP